MATWSPTSSRRAQAASVLQTDAATYHITKPTNVWFPGSRAPVIRGVGFRAAHRWGPAARRPVRLQAQTALRHDSTPEHPCSKQRRRRPDGPRTRIGPAGDPCPSFVQHGINGSDRECRRARAVPMHPEPEGTRRRSALASAGQSRSETRWAPVSAARRSWRDRGYPAAVSSGRRHCMVTKVVEVGRDPGRCARSGSEGATRCGRSASPTPFGGVAGVEIPVDRDGRRLFLAAGRQRPARRIEEGTTVDPGSTISSDRDARVTIDSSFPSPRPARGQSGGARGRRRRERARTATRPT